MAMHEPVHLFVVFRVEETRALIEYGELFI